LDLLNQPLPEFGGAKSCKNPILFNHNFVFRNVSFRYSSSASYALRNINLEINKGDRVGFIGLTGSGKSTLMDLIMGLLKPSEGCLVIDGAPLAWADYGAWQSNIAHVPQSIFLSDATIAENIAFGVAEKHIDLERVRLAARVAQIHDFIQNQPKSYETIIGERGARLSGGQRQRIGIARAIYKNASIIILDEATSALDSTTEISVMNSINHLYSSITVIMVAHRLSTLRNCNKIFEIGDGVILRSGPFQEIIENA
jgi:ATP-binding cassette subfamily B protein